MMPTYRLLIILLSDTAFIGIIRNGIIITHGTAAVQTRNNPAIHLLDALEALQAIWHELCKDDQFLEARLEIEEVEIVLGSPWIRESIHTSIYEKPRPFVITEGFLNDLYFEAEARAAEQLPGYLADSKVLNVYLNGYETEELLGRTATRLDVTACAFVMDEPHYKRVEKTVDSLGHINAMRIHSYRYLAAESASHHLGNDVLYVDAYGKPWDLVSTHRSMPAITAEVRGQDYNELEIRLQQLLKERSGYWPRTVCLSCPEDMRAEVSDTLKRSLPHPDEKVQIFNLEAIQHQNTPFDRSNRFGFIC